VFPDGLAVMCLAPAGKAKRWQNHILPRLKDGASSCVDQVKYLAVQV
jgi:hypothetical protein